MTPEANPTLIREAALIAGVCARPVISQVTDIKSGELRVVPIACGSTRDDRCPPCAERAKRLRIQHCREGWHLDTEPEHATPDDDQADEGQGDEDDGGRRVRSTRRRQDVADLPRVPMADRTIGRVFTAPDGRTYRPSMFLTLTLPSYTGGSPPRASRSTPRRTTIGGPRWMCCTSPSWWTGSGRTCAAAPATRSSTSPPSKPSAGSAPHLHAAMRGTIPRRIVRQVKAATYFQLWWPLT